MITTSSETRYTVRVRIDGEGTRSREWDVQDEREMLVRVRESGVTFAPGGRPSGSDEVGPSIGVYNLASDEISARLTVERPDGASATEGPGERFDTPLPDSYTPTSSADWSALIDEEVTLAERSAGKSVREYCGIGEGRTSIRVSAGNGREGFEVFDVPGESFRLLVVVFEEELSLVQTGFCHFGC